MNNDDHERRVAVLIDAENIAPKYLPIVLSEANNLGSVNIKRIYGDWTMPQMSSWRTVILDNSIQPIQQYSNVSGKNSSDSALIIDAMDLLYRANQPNAALPATAEKTAESEHSEKAAASTGSSGMGMRLKAVRKALIQIWEENSDDDGWIASSQLGNFLNKRFPDFDVRNFQFKKFVPFIDSTNLFEKRTEGLHVSFRLK